MSDRLDALPDTDSPSVGDRVRLQAHDGRKPWWEGLTGTVIASLPPIAVADPRQRPQIELWRVRLDQPVWYVGRDGAAHCYADPTPCVERTEIRRIE